MKTVHIAADLRQKIRVADLHLIPPNVQILKLVGFAYFFNNIFYDAYAGIALHIGIKSSFKCSAVAWYIYFGYKHDMPCLTEFYQLLYIMHSIIHSFIAQHELCTGKLWIFFY